MVSLVDDHEVVADRQEVVADRQESLGKKGRTLLFFSLWQEVCSCWLGLLSPIGKKVSKSQRAVVAGCCERWLADVGCCERWLLGTQVVVNAGRFEHWSLCSGHARRSAPLTPDLVAHA
jgi:hypothetical protein